MKPLELIQIYHGFREAMDGEKIPSELKLRVASEVLHSLPASFLCAAYPATREWLEQCILSEIETLKAANDRTKPNPGDNAEGAQAPQDSAPTVTGRKARKESVGK